VPEPVGLGEDRRVLEDEIRLTMSSPFPGGVVRFTTDGSDPTVLSPRYSGPVDLRLSPAPVTVSARVFLPSGRGSPVARARIVRATWQQPVAVRSGARHPGLSYGYIEGTFRSSDEVKAQKPLRVGTVPGVGLRGDERPEEYGVRLSGLLCVPGDGFYTFYLSSDDGAKLRIGDLLVDRDGPQRESETRGQIALRAGCHAIEVVFFQASGAARLHLELSTPALPRGPAPPEWYAHLQEEAR
jgi:hexosaminidase